MVHPEDFPTWPDVVRFQGGEPALSISDREGFNIRYDAVGRWRAVTLRGPVFGRTHDGRILGRRRRVDGPTLTEVAPEDRAGFHDLVRQRTLDLLRGRIRLVPVTGGAPVAPVLAAIEKAAEWDAARFEADRRRFEDIHGGFVPPLPPDRARALVLGWRSDPSREEGHWAEVRAFFGPSIGLRQGVLLRGAPGAAGLVDRVARVRSRFAESVGDDVGIEVEAEAVPRFERRDLEPLAAAGLRSIAVRFGSSPVSLDPAILAEGRRAGVRWTILLPGADWAPVGGLGLAAGDLVHLPGGTAPAGVAWRAVTGPVEEFLYYA